MEITRLEHFGRFTIAEAKEVAVINGKERKFTGVGISRQSNEDTYDKVKAENIASGRAIKAIRKKQKGHRVNNILMG